MWKLTWSNLRRKLDSWKMLKWLLNVISDLVIVLVWISSCVWIPLLIHTWKVLKTVPWHELLRLIVKEVVGLLCACLTLPTRILYLTRSKWISSIPSISKLEWNINVVDRICKTLFWFIMDKRFRFVANMIHILRNLLLKPLIVRWHLMLRKLLLPKIHDLLGNLLFILNRRGALLAINLIIGLTVWSIVLLVAKAWHDLDLVPDVLLLLLVFVSNLFFLFSLISG